MNGEKDKQNTSSFHRIQRKNRNRRSSTIYYTASFKICLHKILWINKVCQLIFHIYVMYAIREIDLILTFIEVVCLAFEYIIQRAIAFGSTPIWVRTRVMKRQCRCRLPKKWIGMCKFLILWKSVILCSPESLDALVPILINEISYFSQKIANVRVFVF